MSELGKSFLKKSDKKTENQCQNAASENKKTTSEKCKFDSNKKLGLEWTMHGLEKPFRKKSNPKIEETVKTKVKLPHVNKKPLARKRIFVQTPFSRSTLKLERKIHAAEPLAFSLHFLFRRDQKSLLQFDFKNHENVWTEKTAPQYTSNSLNCKNQGHRSIAPLSFQLRSYNW